ncbi:MAG TPA: hypothetical protein PK055_09070 [Gammaproteobacteria bacterium]|nr:hypothetical protein [Xanthomonadales bacterium]MCB1593439.1 hypothetical protein [Xanthomonadales bacterium]HPI96123.1 hypothetical protein [Gammaproteobacteria bacterium]HPQ87795.1 hypothetical protein [Gammaproteobacteria bacterium]
MKRYIILLLLFTVISGSINAEILQSLGVDQRVDYSSLTQYGPWDDRNYQVTKEDLDILPNDDQYLSNVPVFFKIKHRKDNPQIGKYYPRSTLQAFQIQYGGLLVNGSWNKEGLGIGYHPEDTYGKTPENTILAVPSSETPLEIGVNGNEASVECNPTNQNICVAGSNASGGQAMYYSTNAGATWTKSQTNPSSCCDPTIDWSSDGSIVYQADLSSSIGVRWSRSLDQGVTWESMKVLTPSGSDKEWVHVDRSQTSPYKDNVYLTYHNSNVMQFAKSEDFGVTMSTPTSFGSEPQGIGSDITTDTNGNIYYFYPTLSNSHIRVLKSTDGGDSFAAGVQVAPLNGTFDFPIPAMESREAFIYTSADVDTNNNTIYVAWTDETDDSFGGGNGSASQNHGWIQVAKSTDAGANWTMCAQPHDTSDTIGSNPIDRFHPWLKVGENGVVHIVYYDTRHSTNRTGVDLFYTSSTDGCANWDVEERYTTETSVNINNGQEWGDYNGLSVVLDRIVSTHTDNRLVGGSAQQTAMALAGENPKGSPTFNLSVDNSQIEVCSGDTGVSKTINVTPLMDYNNSVTLSPSTTPAFVSNIGFSTNPVSLAGGANSSDLSFDVGAGGTTGIHLFKIIGAGPSVQIVEGSNIVRELDLNILYSGGTTSQTNLTAPANGASNVSLSETFTWDADANATSYRIQIATEITFTNIVVDEVVDTNSYQASELPSSTQLYWRVATQSSCNAQDVWSFAVFNFTTTALPGDCVIGLIPVATVAYDFESGAQGWTHSAAVGQDGWSISTSNPHSGIQSFFGAPFGSNNDTSLTSPQVSLPIGRSPLTLQFWNHQSMEDRSGGGCWDGGLLEISTDGGNNFDQVPNSAMFSDPYDGALGGGPLSGSDAWCGDPQDYLNSIVDIDSYSGQDVVFRFRKSNDGSVAHGGWHIDDVRVVGCDTDLIFENGFEVVPAQ